MECDNVRENLSAYLEGLLSQEDKVRIEEHLRSCAVCSAELIDLTKTVEHIRGLEEVEPPAWMTQKIMAKVREEGQGKKRILQRLFYPLHVKLPLEAVAALLVVGLALYIYRDISPEMRLAKAPMEESSPQTTQREIIKEDKIGPFKKSEERNVPDEVTTAPEKPAEEPATGKLAAKAGRMEAAPRASELPRQSELSYKELNAPPASVAEAARSAAGGLRKEAKPEAVQAAPKLKGFGEKKMEGILLTVRVKELESANREVEKLITSLGGKIIDRQSIEGGKILVAEVNSVRFNELLEKLKSIGEVKEKEEMKGFEGATRLKIEVVAPRLD